MPPGPLGVRGQPVAIPLPHPETTTPGGLAIQPAAYRAGIQALHHPGQSQHLQGKGVGGLLDRPGRV